MSSRHSNFCPLIFVSGFSVDRVVPRVRVASPLQRNLRRTFLNVRDQLHSVVSRLKLLCVYSADRPGKSSEADEQNSPPRLDYVVNNHARVNSPSTRLLASQLRVLPEKRSCLLRFVR